MRPRVGFLGTGWIGRHRMAAMVAGGAIEVAALCDPAPDALAEARRIAPGAAVAADLDALLALGLDAMVIATPSALHADQAIRCLAAGTAVFCQKPLGRDAREAARVIAAARRADRLLAVDFSYRHARAMTAIAALVRSGALGRVFALDLVFHNAYGPDKAWFYDRALSGGGCLIDLGSHLVDLAHWLVGPDAARDVAATLFRDGRPFVADGAAVEDYATARFTLGDGVAVSLACSWRLHAGRDAIIGVAVHGTEGGAALANVEGSFYDFEATRFRGTTRETLAAPPDDWGARAATAFADRAARALRYDPDVEDGLRVAQTLDALYAAG